MKSTVARMPGNALPKTDERAGKYLTFRLDKEEFAIQVPRIREIMAVQQITPLPQTPGFVKGVISLRGKVIPVIDLRVKFGMARIESTPRSSIIVTEIDCDGGHAMLGTLVDCVTEVLTLKPGEIDNARAGDGPAKPYLLGIAKIKGKVKTLLDINVILTPQEIRDLEAVLQPA